jgi:hypothetical protein
MAAINIWWLPCVFNTIDADSSTLVTQVEVHLMLCQDIFLHLLNPYSGSAYIAILCMLKHPDTSRRPVRGFHRQPVFPVLRKLDFTQPLLVLLLTIQQKWKSRSRCIDLPKEFLELELRAIWYVHKSNGLRPNALEMLEGIATFASLGTSRSAQTRPISCARATEFDFHPSLSDLHGAPCVIWWHWIEMISNITPIKSKLKLRPFWQSPQNLIPQHIPSQQATFALPLSLHTHSLQTSKIISNVLSIIRRRYSRSYLVRLRCARRESTYLSRELA